MNIIRRAIIWLLTKQEKKTMTDQVVDVSAQSQPIADQAINTDPAPVAENAAPVVNGTVTFDNPILVASSEQNEQATQEQPSALAALKASFAAKLQFIETGIAALGADAEKELVDLAEKYL